MVPYLACPERKFNFIHEVKLPRIFSAFKAGDGWQNICPVTITCFLTFYNILQGAILPLEITYSISLLVISINYYITRYSLFVQLVANFDHSRLRLSSILICKRKYLWGVASDMLRHAPHSILIHYVLPASARA